MLRLFRKNPGDPARLIADFLSLPEHAWIAADRGLLHRMAEFFSLVPAADLELVLRERRLLLLYCNQRMSAAFHQFEGREIVLVFPDLKRLLLSAQHRQGFAVLAHELGHIVRGHSREAVEAQRAQLEADGYARSLGFGEELQEVLRFETSYDEVRARLQALRAA